MRKYLGSRITAYAAFSLLLFIAGPILFAVSVMHGAPVSIATIFLYFMCISGSLLSVYILLKHSWELYAWGDFQSDAVCVRSLFHKPFILHYSRVKSCGIAYYRHAFMNDPKSCLGSNVYFIFISYDMFDEKYRVCINMWSASTKRIKVAFSEELYNHLITTLPPKQAKMLVRDYSLFIQNNANRDVSCH